MADQVEPVLQRKMLSTLLAVGYTVALFKDNGGTELTDPGYGRQGVTFLVTSLPPILARNSNSIIFGPAGSAWPPVTHIGVFDSAGALQFKRKLLSPASVSIGETLPISVGAIEVGYA